MSWGRGGRSPAQGRGQERRGKGWGGAEGRWWWGLSCHHEVGAHGTVGAGVDEVAHLVRASNSESPLEVPEALIQHPDGGGEELVHLRVASLELACLMPRVATRGEGSRGILSSGSGRRGEEGGGVCVRVRARARARMCV